MAATPPCDLHAELLADFIIGVTETGEQLFLCTGDAARFGLTLALQTLPLDEIRGEVDSLVTPNGQTDHGGPADAPARKSRRKKTTTEEPDAGPEPRLQEAAPGADDR